MLLGLESEGVHVDTHGRHVGVVLERLHLVEIAALANLEPVVAVELEQGSDARVLARHALHASDGVARLQHGAVPPVGEVEGLLSLPAVDHRVVARHEGVTLHNPHQLLARVVEVQLELVGGAGDGLGTSELEGLNQVLVGHLGELATLVRVQVDVVHVQGGGLEVRGSHAVADGVVVAGQSGCHVPAEVTQVVELQVDTHLVVLEGNQRQGQTRVAAEPELERNVQRVGRGAHAKLVGHVGLTAGTVIVARLATLHQQVGQHGHVTHHLGIAGLLPGLLGKLIPDVQPVAIVLVDTLATNLNLHGLDKVVPHPVEPAELSTRAIAGLESHRRQGGLEVHAVDQVTITLDGAGHTLAEARRAVERVLNGLHGKVGVSPVHNLKEGNLGITREVNILCAIGNKLHQTTTRHLLYPFFRNKFLEIQEFSRKLENMASAPEALLYLPRKETLCRGVLFLTKSNPRIILYKCLNKGSNQLKGR